VTNWARFTSSWIDVVSRDDERCFLKPLLVRNVTKFEKCDNLTFENGTEYHTIVHFLKSMVQNYVYLLRLDFARNESELCTIFKDQPPLMCTSWYLSGTKHFHPTILDCSKWKPQVGEVIKPVPYNLVQMWYSVPFSNVKLSHFSNFVTFLTKKGFKKQRSSSHETTTIQDDVNLAQLVTARDC